MAIEKERISSKTIILDTSEYAGNFERELCAYITGQVGDYGVGEEIANQSNIENLTWWNENINPQEVEMGLRFLFLAL